MASNSTSLPVMSNSTLPPMDSPTLGSSDLSGKIQALLKSPSLPVLNPFQRGSSPLLTKNTLARRSSPESLCSTSASDTETEGTEGEKSQDLTRSLCAADVDWLLESLTQEQKVNFDRSHFHRECQRIFRLMDADESGFLDHSELENVIAHLVPGPPKTLDSPCGHQLVMSIRSVLAIFDKDSDEQLSSEEFPDFVRFCYAWRSQQDRSSSMDVASDLVQTAPRGRAPTSQSPPCGAAHRLVRSASMSSSGFLTPPLGSLPPKAPTSASRASKPVLRRSCSSPHFGDGASLSEPSKLKKLSEPSSRRPSKPVLRRSDSSPHFGQGASLLEPSSRRPSKSVVSRGYTPSSAVSGGSTPPTRSSTPEGLPSIPGSPPGSPRSLPAKKAMSRPATRSGTSSRQGSRRPSTSPAPGSRRGSKSKTSSRPASPEPDLSMRPVRKEELAARQMLALKALLAELVKSYKNLPDLIAILLHNTMGPDGCAAFDNETLEHVCELVSKPAAKDEYDMSPKSNGGHVIAAFLHAHGHISEEHPTDSDLLVEQALEAVILLSLRWFAMKNHVCLPDMSDYQRQKWLPPAFSHLVGQILWRNRTSPPLQNGHTPVVEHLRWIATSPGAEEDMMDRCNAVFKALSGSSSGHLKLQQWRKVMELLATNPNLRARSRRCDAVKACYGDAVNHSEGSMNRKQFKLMLLKTADLMSVHPLVLFRELARHVEDLEQAKKDEKHAKSESSSPEVFK